MKDVVPASSFILKSSHIPAITPGDVNSRAISEVKKKGDFIMLKVLVISVQKA